MTKAHREVDQKEEEKMAGEILWALVGGLILGGLALYGLYEAVLNTWRAFH